MHINLKSRIEVSVNTFVISEAQFSKVQNLCASCNTAHTCPVAVGMSRLLVASRQGTRLCAARQQRPVSTLVTQLQAAPPALVPLAFLAVTVPFTAACFTLIDCMFHRDLILHKWHKQVEWLHLYN
jgi:hypothetical protein